MFEDIKGLGPKNKELLDKLNIKNIDDLINFYPFRYNFIVPTELKDGPVVITGIIESTPVTTYIKKNLNKLFFRVETSNYLVNVTLFNRAFMKNNLRPGTEVTVIGEYDERHNSVTADDIRLKKIDSAIIEPVYHLTSGISSKLLHNLINNALMLNPPIIDYIPEYLVEKYEFQDKESSLKMIHNPLDLDRIKGAIVRLKYEELFRFMFKINYLKSCRTDKGGLPRIADTSLADEFIKQLPFELTDDQVSSVKDIISDLKAPKRMNRLLLGDVGSGKTIVGIVAVYYNYLSGYQSSLLAPTEILAVQHYFNITKLFKPYGIRVELLKGGMTKKEKSHILEGLASGEIDLLIGTHAILEDNVEFKNLGLVITDEQHRFGVNQRSNFQNKGVSADVLYMSATPIPRTYALTVYGDMDISYIKTKPAGRKPVKTELVKFKDMKYVLSEMLDELKKNHQIYIVCPLIETDDESDLTDVTVLKKKIDTAYNNKVPVEILHGKLKSDEKEHIMEDFKEGKTKILISTTVIEVGVDVPNATMMVIFNAERFGLATIHQLRGRIGRNSLESKCIMISDKTPERLNVLVESNDGFYISEQDFKMRGEGDLFGVRQSGDMVFKIADLRSDMKVLTQANVDTSEFIKNNKDDDFEEHPIYKKVIDELNHLD